MKNTSTKKKNKRSRPKKVPAVNGSSSNTPRKQDQLGEVQQEEVSGDQRKKQLNTLVEAFCSISLEEATSAYNLANVDLNKAADILSSLVDNDNDLGNESEDPEPSTSSISSASSSSVSSGSGFSVTGCVQNLNSGRGRCRGGKKQKRVVAATGTVSTVLGKEYVKGSPRRNPTAESAARSVFLKEEKEEVEQFLCSMLGDGCELSMAVVRDVLCQCGYNVEKALDALLDLSASSFEQSKSCNDSVNNRQDIGFFSECSDSLTDRDCMSISSESELQDSIWSVGYGHWNYSKVLASSEAPVISCPRSNVLDLPQDVLDSLFNTPKSCNQEPSTMNWRNVVKQMQSSGPGVDVCSSSVVEPHHHIYAKGDEYHQLRKTAKEHWDSMRSYYQRAAVAHSKGEREYAAYLSDQGKIQTKLAREAEERASQDIFKVRNKDFKNATTIDLHGQHVKQAMKLLKQHLLFGAHVSSVRTLRVITGCGMHGMGKAKLKQSVIKLLEKEGIQWHEENPGAVLVKLDGYREFSFLDYDSDTE